MSYFLCALILFTFAGLRTRGNDTFTYRNTYLNHIGTGMQAFKQVNWMLGANPGYNITAIALKTIGFSVQDYLMAYAAVTVSIYLWFIRKYSKNLSLSLYLFITIGCYLFAFAAIKQSLATAIGLIGIDRYINRKKFGFFIWIAIAATFHPYVLMFLITPFLNFRVWSKWSYILICATIVAGIALRGLLGAIVYITDEIGETYDVESFTGAGVNIIRVIVCMVPVCLSFLKRKQFLSQTGEDKKQKIVLDNLFLNLTFMNASIMFVGLFGTANYFARLANYFLIFQTISYPIVLSKFPKQNRKTISFFLVFLYF